MSRITFEIDKKWAKGKKKADLHKDFPHLDKQDLDAYHDEHIGEKPKEKEEKAPE